MQSLNTVPSHQQQLTPLFLLGSWTGGAAGGTAGLFLEAALLASLSRASFPLSLERGALALFLPVLGPVELRGKPVEPDAEASGGGAPADSDAEPRFLRVGSCRALADFGNDFPRTILFGPCQHVSQKKKKRHA